MTAKKMFEKMGFTYSVSTSNVTLKKTVIVSKGNIKMTFTEDINKPNVWGCPSILDIETLKAINKQTRELGW